MLVFCDFGVSVHSKMSCIIVICRLIFSWPERSSCLELDAYLAGVRRGCYCTVGICSAGACSAGAYIVPVDVPF